MNENQTTQNQNNKEKSSDEQRAEQNASSAKNIQAGPIVGSVIVIVVLVLGGLYFLGKKVSEEGVFAPEPEAIQNAPDKVTDALQEQGTSDEIADIEKDLDATILDELDAELKDIETELNI